MTEQDSKLGDMWEKIFSDFITYMSSDENQNQLGVGEDLLPGMSYTRVRSPDGLNTGRVTIWRGVMLPQGCDAQMNIEYQPFAEDTVHLQIRHHKHQNTQGNAYKLNDLESWIIDEK